MQNYVSILDYIEEEYQEEERRRLIEELSKETNVVDINLEYLRKLKQYTLLTPEEELFYGKQIRLVDSLEIVKDKTYKANLDLAKIFVSLTKENIDVVLSTLMQYYSVCTESADRNIYTLLKQYTYIFEQLGHALTIRELKFFFSAILGEKGFDEYIPVEPDLLIQQVTDFIQYDKAFSVFYFSNLRLVVSIAKKFRGEFEFMDAVQEGNIGLMKAIAKYQPEFGNRFSTMAIYWIRQEITRANDEKGHMIRLSYDKSEFLRKIVRAQRSLTQKLFRKPTIDEIAAVLKVPRKKIEFYMVYLLEVLSFNSPLCGDDDNLTLSDVVSSQRSIEIDYIELEMKKIYLNNLNLLLDTLRERDKEVLSLRFGLNNEVPHKLEDIGKILNITSVRAGQLEKDALRRAKTLIETDEHFISLRHIF